MKTGKVDEQDLARELLKLMIRIDELMLQIIEQQRTRLLEQTEQIH